MKKLIKYTVLFLTLCTFFSINLKGQGLEAVKDNIVPTQKAFRKGCFLVSLSGGSTTANYSTHKSGESVCRSNPIYSKSLDGERDPLFIEFGLTDKWGIGFSSGNDLFAVNTLDYYGFHIQKSNEVTAKTAEFTFDLNYHLFTSRKVDISVYGSVGSFGVAFSGSEGDFNYNYNAKGSIVRVGTKARYYFRKRFGVLGMLSYYSGTASPDGVKGNTLSNNVSTTITGYALEFGLCYRFF